MPEIQSLYRYNLLSRIPVCIDWDW